MAKFISAGRYGLVNLDHVTRVVRKADKDNKYEVGSTTLELKDGTSYTVDGDLSKWIAHMTATTVPALPGYQVIVVSFDEKLDPTPALVVEHCWRIPIVAWRVTEYDFVEPVTLDDFSESEEQPVGIVCPDGQVIVQSVADYANVEAWAHAISDDWKEWKARETNVTPIKRKKATG